MWLFPVFLFFFFKVAQLIRHSLPSHPNFFWLGQWEKPLSPCMIRIWKFCPPPSAKFVHTGLIGAKSCQSFSWWTSTISWEHVNSRSHKILTFHKLMLGFCEFLKTTDPKATWHHLTLNGVQYDKLKELLCYFGMSGHVFNYTVQNTALLLFLFII